MDVYHGAEFFRLLPEWPQRRIAQFHVPRRRRYADAGEAEFAHAPREFADRQRRRDERHATEADEPFRVGRNHRCHVVIERALQPKALLRLGPVGRLLHEARRQHLHVDTHGVHVDDAFSHVRHARHQHGLTLLHALSRLFAHGRVRIGFHEHAVRPGDSVYIREHQMGMKVDDATRAGWLFHDVVSLASWLISWLLSWVMRRCSGKIWSINRSARSPHTPRGALSMIAIATAPSMSR